MLDASYDLNQSDSNSFGPPDTPRFSFVEQGREGLDLSGQALRIGKEIIRESFELQKEVNPHEEQSAWSLGIVNAPKIVSDENGSDRASEEMSDSPLRQRPVRAIILSNFVDTRKIDPDFSSEGEEAASEPGSKKERSFDNLENTEMRPKKKSSFVLSNNSEQDFISDSLNQGSAYKEKAQSNEENEDTILEDAQPGENESELPQSAQEQYQSSIFRRDFNESQSHQDKQNMPVSVVPQALLPVIREQNSGKSLEQSESQGQTINVNQSTLVRDQTSEEEQEQVSKKCTKITKKEKIYQTTVKQSLFWKIQTVNNQEREKRHRTKPCKFWMLQSVKYLKNNQIIKKYRKTIEEVFLKLNQPSEILDYNTVTATDHILNGDITMKPKSKVKINQIPGRVIMSILAKKSKGSFIYEKNRVKVVDIDDGGCIKLTLNNPKIRELKNTLDEPCKIYVKIYYQN